MSISFFLRMASRHTCRAIFNRRSQYSSGPCPKRDMEGLCAVSCHGSTNSKEHRQIHADGPERTAIEVRANGTNGAGIDMPALPSNTPDGFQRTPRVFVASKLQLTIPESLAESMKQLPRLNSDYLDPSNLAARKTRP
jgi:hypothetical protein